MKPGYKTSEFWFTLVSFIFSGLFLLGFIGDSAYKDELIEQVSHGVESVVLIGGQLLILYKYVKGRAEIKKKIEDKKSETMKPTQVVTTEKQKQKSKKKPTNKKKPKNDKY